MKLIEIYKQMKESNKKLFYSNSLQNVECMREYESNTGISQIDKIIIRKYGSREFESLEDDYDNILGEWEDVVEGYILSNQYNLDKMWEMLHEEYDPLYNYDKTSDITNTHAGDILIKTGGEKEEYSKSGSETHTDTKSGSETHTDTKSGSETHTDTKSGTETHTDTKSGSETNTLSKNGSENTTKSIGAQSNTTTNKNTAWDNTSDYKVNVEEVSSGAHTDTDELSYMNRQDTDVLTFANRKDEDVLTFANRQDTDVLTFANRQDTDVLTFADRQDTDVLTFANRKDTKDTTFINRKDSINYSDTIHEVTKGNIGTTTSSDLMIKEFDARWKVNFYMELFTNLIFDLTW